MSSPKPQPLLTIFRGFLDAGTFVWSPYVTKLEAHLRFSGLPYKTAIGSPREGPKGKIPYISISRNDNNSTTETLGDSSLIVATLCERGALKDLNKHLSRAERAQDLALRALLEDKLSFYHTWERWTQNYYTMRDHVLWSLPWPLRVVIGALVHRNTVAVLHGQGTGRFSGEEIAAFRREIWEGFADLLLASRAEARSVAARGEGEEEEEPFWVLGGPEPTEADTALFGFIVSTLLCTAGPGSQADVKSFPVLSEYARRIQARYFPDYQALPQ